MRADDRLHEVGSAMLADRARRARKNVRDAKRGDEEGVHDLRVGIRKVHAALSILAETVVLPRNVRRYDDELKAVFSVLGEARDDDVMTKRVRDLAVEHDLEGKDAADLIAKLERARGRARRRLVSVMRRHPPKRTLSKLARAVADHGPAEARDGGEQRPTLVRHFLGSALLARYEQMLAYEVALPAPLPVLHRMRVAVKKLRYAIDFFEDCLGPRAESLDATLAGAQDELGALHDLSVARAYVSRFARRSGSKAGVLLVRALDECSERALSDIGNTLKELTGPSFRASLFEAIAYALGPLQIAEPTLVRCRAESAA